MMPAVGKPRREGKATPGNAVSSKTLFEIVEEGNIVKFVDAVVNRGADINCHRLMRLPKFDVEYVAFKKIVNNGASVAAGEVVTPLIFAAWLGSVSMVKVMILELGADIRMKSDDGFTCLHCAAYGTNVELVNFLLDSGCDARECDVYDLNSVGWAARGGCKDVVEILLNRYPDILKKKYEHFNPLHLASSKGHRNVVEFLLDRGVNINDRVTFNRCSSIHAASVKGHAEIVELLLNRGANIQDIDKDGNTSLHVSCNNSTCRCNYHLKGRPGHKTMVQLLLSRGADLHPKTKSRKTPLYFSCNNNCTDTLKRWPVTMVIVCMQNLIIFQYLDVENVVDLGEYIGEEDDYIEKEEEEEIQQYPLHADFQYD